MEANKTSSAVARKVRLNGQAVSMDHGDASTAVCQCDFGQAAGMVVVGVGLARQASNNDRSSRARAHDDGGKRVRTPGRVQARGEPPNHCLPLPAVSRVIDDAARLE